MSDELQKEDIVATDENQPEDAKKPKREMEEKSKKRILIIACCLCFLIALILTLVFTLKKCDDTGEPNLKGKVTFETTDADVSISNASLEHADGTSYIDAYAGDFSNIFKPLDFVAGGEAPADLTSWANLQFNFNKTMDDLVIRFTITNNGTEKLDFVTINVITPNTEESNVDVILSSNYEILAPVGNTLIQNEVEYTITFSVPDKTKAASLKDFEIKFNIDKNEELGISDVRGDINFTSTNTNISINDAKLVHADGSDYNANVSGNDLNNILKNLVFTAGGNAPADLSTWKNLELNFDEDKSDLFLKFKVKNNSTGKLDYIRFNSNVVVPEGSNIGVEVVTKSILLGPANSDNEAEVVVKFSVIDETRPGKLSGFAVNFTSSVDEVKSKANLSGKVEFNVTDANITITNAKFVHTDGSDYDANVSEKALSEFIKDLVFTVGGEAPATLSSWQGLKLNFDKDLSDLVLKFTVTNNGTGKLDYLRVNASVDAGSNINVTTTSSTLLEPKRFGEIAQGEEYKITFSVKDKTKELTPADFAVTLNIAKDEEKGYANLNGNVNFNVINADVSITNAKLLHADGSAYDANVSDIPFALLLMNLNFTPNGNAPENLASWQGLKLNFDEDLNDIVLKFTVTNNGTGKLDYLRVNASADAGSDINVTTTNSTLLYPDVVGDYDNIVEYSITFSLKDKTQRPKQLNFTANVNIAKDAEASKANLTGNVEFSVTDANVTISNARFVYTDGSSYDANVSENRLSDLLKELVFTESGNTPADLSSWQNLALNFDKDLNDLVLKFKVTNNGTKKLDVLSVDVTAENGEIIDVEITPRKILGKGNEVEYKITFSLKDRTQRPSQSNFIINVNIAKDEVASKANLTGNVEFNVTDADVTVSNAKFEHIDGSVYDANVSENELTDLVKDLVFTANGQTPSAVTSWQNLALNFDEDLSDLVLKFTVTNNGIGKLDYLRVNADVSAGENVNITTTLSTLVTPVIEGESGNVVEYAITFSVLDKEHRPSVSVFNVSVNVAKDEEKGYSNLSGNVEFDVINSDVTISNARFVHADESDYETNMSDNALTSLVNDLVFTSNGNTPSAINSWKGLKLNFDEELNDLILKFTVTNNGAGKFDYLRVNADVLIGANINVTTTSSSLLSPVKKGETGNEVEYVVIFAVADKTHRPQPTDFTITIKIDKDDELGKVDLVGNVTFNVADSNIKVSNATLSDEVYVGDEVNILSDLTFTANGETPSEVSKWQDLLLNFNQDKDDIVLTLTITNEGMDSNDFVDLTVVPTSANSNIAIDVSNTSMLLAPSSNTYLDSEIELTIILSVVDKTQFTKLNNFNIEFNLAKNTEAITASSIENLEFDYDFTEHTASVKNVTLTTDGENVTIPEKIRLDEDGEIYTFTSIDFSKFEGCNIGTLTLPKSVNEINIGAGTYVDSTHTTRYYDTNWTCQHIVIDEENTTYKSMNDSIVDIENNQLIFSVNLTDSNARSAGKVTVIPDGVVSIGNDAFYTLVTKYSDDDRQVVTRESAFTNVQIPESVKFIGSRVFQNATKLENVEFPSSLQAIGNNAFNNTKALAINVVFPNTVRTIGESAFRYSGITGITLPSSLEKVSNRSFAECSDLAGAVVIPANVQVIEEYAFYQDAKLGKVSMSEGVTTIGQRAFSACRGMTEAIIPESIQTLGDYAFGYCESLTSQIVLPYATDIGAFAFIDCKLLPTIEINSTLTEIKESTFAGCELFNNVYIPANIKTIGKNAFLRCKGLDSLTIANGVVTIGEQAFHQCENLTQIEIPTSVRTINNGAFNACKNLENVVLSEGLVTIGNAVFSGCLKLDKVYLNGTNEEDIPSGSVILPETVETLGENAFFNLAQIKNLTIGNSLTSIGNAAFFGAGIEGELNLKNVITIGNKAFQGTKMSGLTLSGEGVTFGNQAFWACANLIRVDTVGSGYIKEIGNDAFNGARQLEFIDLKEGLESIGEKAFYQCINLDIELTLTSSMKNIGSYAFFGCVNLKTVILEGITEIKEATFSGCTSITDLVLPDTLEVIGGSAFSGCTGLNEITIPASVTTINENAFYNCTNLYYVQIDSDTVADLGFGSKRNDQGYVTAYAKVVYAKREGIAFTTEWHNHPQHSITPPASYTVTNSDGSETTYYGYTNWYPDITGSASFTTEEGFVFTKERGQYYLDGYTGSQSSVVLPTTYRRSSYTLRKIESPAVFSITVPDIEIMELAFRNNDKLAEIINTSSIDLSAEKTTYGIENDINVITDASESTLYIDNDGFVFNGLNSENYLIAYIGENTEITLPASYNEESYKIKKYAFYNNDIIIKVEIPEGITEIGLYAFENCSMLASVKIPSTVTLIGTTNDQPTGQDSQGNDKYGTDDTIFKGCTKLVEIVNLSRVRVASPDSNAIIITSGDSTVDITDYVFYGESGNYTLLQYIGEETRLTLPENYKGEQYNIAAHAFDGSALKYVKISSGVKSIGDYAFNRCRSLATVEFDEGVESIGDYAFFYTPITEITLPSTVKTIGRYAFNSCGGLKTVNLNEGLQYIDSAAFGACSALNNINLPSTLTSVGTYVFNGAINLKSITIPASLEVINDYMFNGCSGLENVVIENGVQTISQKAFRNCTSLTDVVLPESVKTVGDNAFEGCINLRNVVMEGVETIRDNAFHNCVELTDISIPDTIVSISKFAFGDTSGDGYHSEDYVPNPSCTKLSYTEENGLRYLGNATNPYVYLISRTYSNQYEIADGCKIIGYSIFSNNGISTIEIPASVRYIYPYAFYYCYSLETVTFNEGLENIQQYAFAYCSNLGNIELPSTVKTIDEYAFYNCSKLNFNALPDSLETIKDRAFENCYAITELRFPSNTKSIGWRAFINNTSLETIILNEGLEKIGGNAFENTRIETITIPSTVTEVYASTFDNCPNLLEVVNLSNVPLTINNGYTSVITSLDQTSIDRTTESGYVFYKLNGEYQLAHCESEETEIVLPGLYKGEEYNISANAFEKCPNVTKITIPASVRNVNKNAFTNVSTLTNLVNYTGTVVYGSSNCTIENKDEFDFTADGWTSTVGEDVTDDQENVTSTTTYENAEWQFKEEKVRDKEGNPVSTTVTLVKYKGSATNLVIPKFTNDKIYKIGDEAFKANTVLESVVIPSCVDEIGANAFNSCNHIKKVELRVGLKTIGSSAFASCQSLEEITIPSSVTTIGSYTFNGAKMLKTVVVNAGVDLPSNMFRNCSALTSVTLGDSVKSIGQQVFFGCSALTNVTIGTKVSKIENQAFIGCTALKNITIPGNVETIGTNAFENCTSLEDVDILTVNKNTPYLTIASKAFLNCTGLTKFIIPKSANSVASDAFEGCTNLVIVLNNSSKDFVLTGSFDVTKDEDDLKDKVDIIDGYTFRTNYMGVTVLEAIPSGQTEIVLPSLTDGKTYKIPTNMFQNNQAITSVSIPGCVTEIEDDAFNGCRGLKTVTIEEGNLNRIGIRAFAACYALTSINIPSTVTEIGNYSFNSCKALTRIVIPASVQSVGASAFIHCTITIVNLTNLDLQSTLTGGSDGVLTFTTTLD